MLLGNNRLATTIDYSRLLCNKEVVYIIKNLNKTSPKYYYASNFYVVFMLSWIHFKNRKHTMTPLSQGPSFNQTLHTHPHNTKTFNFNCINILSYCVLIWHDWTSAFREQQSITHFSPLKNLSLKHKSHFVLVHTPMLSFHVLWGLSIDIITFILYKLYILSLNPNLTP